jgi:hypothetical protein
METEASPMVFVHFTTGISRDDLARECLQQVRMWPGCETVGAVGIFGLPRERFAARVMDYGLASKKLADRALKCIEREKLRHYHLKME